VTAFEPELDRPGLADLNSDLYPRDEYQVPLAVTPGA
jgi:hypothetical protein